MPGKTWRPFIQTLRTNLGHLLKHECRCEICMEPLAADSLCHFLCQYCWSQLPVVHNPCCQCGDSMPHSFQGKRCLRCQQQPPAYDYCISRFRFSSPIDQWIRLGKDKRQPEWMVRLAQLMWSGPVPPLDMVDALVYIPSHWQRLLWRGYNPAAMLAGQISRYSDIPLLDHTLLRVRHLEQRHLRVNERHRQIRTSMQGGQQPLAGLRLLLIEDVVTSGATANWAAQLLKQQGAAMVGVWTLARTPAPQSHTAP